MVGDFFESDGWEVMYVGAATPAADLARLAAEVEPNLVGLSTTLTTHLDAARAAIAALKALPSPPVVMVGGSAYSDDPEIGTRMGPTSSHPTPVPRPGRCEHGSAVTDGTAAKANPLTGRDPLAGRLITKYRRS